MITNQLFKIFGKVTATPNEYEMRFQELITIASAVGVAASMYFCIYYYLELDLIH